MVVINYNNREVSCKIVYYGPGLSGKTTNLQYVHGKVPGKTRGDLISLATDADRTLYFDFLPINIGDINGFTTKFQLYTVPGQVFYNATRKLVLRGVDGVVFVADSQAAKADENVESLNNLKENLSEYSFDLKKLPFVLQYNKRDLPDVMTIDQLNELLNDGDWPVFEACANKGTGVFDTLKYVIKLVLDHAKKSQETTPAGGDSQLVEDAQLPPEVQEPVSQPDEPLSVEKTDIAPVETEHGGPEPVSATQPEVVQPDRVPEQVTKQTEKQTEHEYELAARAESPSEDVTPITKTESPAPAKAAVPGQPSESTTADAQTGAYFATALADTPAKKKDEALERINVVTEDKIDEQESSVGTEGTVGEVDSSIDTTPAEAEPQTDDKLYEKLPGLEHEEKPSVPDEDAAESEAFTVPTMQKSLRAKQKKNKGFFLFRWLFRKG